MSRATRFFYIKKYIHSCSPQLPSQKQQHHHHTTAAMVIAAPSVSLSAPYSIFPLSQPLRAKDREDGTYRACFTSSVESTKKRKRAGVVEIVVAVDGEGVNIYDVWQLTFPRTSERALKLTFPGPLYANNLDLHTPPRHEILLRSHFVLCSCCEKIFLLLPPHLRRCLYAQEAAALLGGTWRLQQRRQS